MRAATVPTTHAHGLDAATQDAWRAGMQALDSGDIEQAEARFRDVLATADPAHPYRELYAWAGLSTLYARMGRDFEALVLLRQMTDRTLAMGDLERSAGTLVNYCSVLKGLRPHADPRPALAELEDLLARLPADAAAMAREDVEQVRVAVFTEDGAFDAAEAAALRFEQATSLDTRVWRKTVTALQMRAYIAAGRGEIGQALGLLDRAEAAGATCPGLACHLIVQRLTTTLGGGADDAVRREAWRALDLLRLHATTPALASARIALGRATTAALDRLGVPDAGEWSEAQDLMASAILDRIVQLDGATRALPDLGMVGAPAAALLATLRRAFRREQAEALRRVADRLRDRRDLPEVLAASYERGWVRLCAWCERVAPSEGVWLPVGHYVPHDGGVRLTHTICSSCAAAMEAGAGV